MTEYISKKIPKEANAVLKYVQAHIQLEKGENVTESDVFEIVLEHYAEEKYGYKQKQKKSYKLSEVSKLKTKKVRKGLGLLPFAGFIKGGPKSSWKDIDKIVYGV